MVLAAAHIQPTISKCNRNRRASNVRTQKRPIMILKQENIENRVQRCTCEISVSFRPLQDAISKTTPGHEDVP